MRTSSPSTFSPDGSVTVASVGGGPSDAAPRPPRPPRPPPPDTQRFCSVSRIGNPLAMPCRSPVGEWQLAHFAAK